MSKRLRIVLIAVGVVVVAGATVWATLFRYRPVESVEELVGVWAYESTYITFKMDWSSPISSLRYHLYAERASYDGSNHLLFTPNGKYAQYGPDGMFHPENGDLFLYDYGTYLIDGNILKCTSVFNFEGAEYIAIHPFPLDDDEYPLMNAFRLKLAGPKAQHYILRKIENDAGAAIKQIQDAGLLTDSPASPNE